MVDKFIYTMAAIWIIVGLIALLAGDPVWGSFTLLCSLLAIAFTKHWI